jgi:excisionase family DNA binding protein
MPEMTLSEAASWAGKGRPAILKAIQKGVLSARKDEGGQWRIDPSELQRVYPPAPKGNTESSSHVDQETATARDREIALMREMLDAARRERDDWKSEANKWQEQAAAVRLLTPPPAEPLAPAPLKRWRWPFG